MSIIAPSCPSIKITRKPTPDGSALRALRQADRLLLVEADEIHDVYVGPTAGPDFTPSPDEDAEWTALAAGWEADREDDAWAEALAAERLEDAFGVPACDGPRETDQYAPGYVS